MNSPTADTDRTARTTWRVATIIIIAVLVTIFVYFRELLSLDSLIQRQDELRNAIIAKPALVYGSAFILYVIAAGLSFPGALLMTIAFGWLFGFWIGLVLVSFASTAGATIAFLLSRYLFRNAIQSRFGDRLATFNNALKQEGAFYLFSLRLLPQVPFFLVNLVMGLTPIPTPTFWWVSQLGMLPGTCVYVYTGASLGNLEDLRDKGLSGLFTWQLGLAFALLGFFPLIVKRLIGVFSSRSVAPPSS